MITDAVQDVLFEAACFDGTNIKALFLRESDFVQMLLVNSRRDWIQTMHRKLLTAHAS